MGLGRPSRASPSLRDFFHPLIAPALLPGSDLGSRDSGVNEVGKALAPGSHLSGSRR